MACSGTFWASDNHEAPAGTVAGPWCFHGCLGRRALIRALMGPVAGAAYGSAAVLSILRSMVGGWERLARVLLVASAR